MDTATYIEALPPVLYDFTHINWWRLIAGAWLVVGIFAFRERRFWQWSLFLMAWVFLLAILPITRAVLVRSRYFLPIAPPLTLLLALMIVYSWERAKGLSMGIGALTAIWAFSFALPFIWTDLNSPAELTFKTENWTEYTAGYFLSDAAVQQAAQDLNALNLTNERVYAPWNLCHLLYFHSTYPIQCLSRESPLGDINRLMRAEVGINESVYFVMADYSRLFFQEVENTRWQLISQYERQNIKRPVSLWQGWWTSGQH